MAAQRPGTYSIEKAQKVRRYLPLVTLDEGMQRVAERARAEGVTTA